MAAVFAPAFYYLVLFDFAAAETAPDDSTAEESAAMEIVTIDVPTILSRIWRVDPRVPGFAMCIIDYYVNIRAKSTSKAPFNLWPFSLKFQLMRPDLIYQARILPDDQVATDVFEGAIGDVQTYAISPLTSFAGSHVNLPTTSIVELAQKHDVGVDSGTRSDLLAALEEARVAQGWTDDDLATELASSLYSRKIEGSEAWLPAASG